MGGGGEGRHRPAGGPARAGAVRGRGTELRGHRADIALISHSQHTATALALHWHCIGIALALQGCSPALGTAQHCAATALHRVGAARAPQGSSTAQRRTAPHSAAPRSLAPLRTGSPWHRRRTGAGTAPSLHWHRAQDHPWVPPSIGVTPVVPIPLPQSLHRAPQAPRAPRRPSHVAEPPRARHTRGPQPGCDSAPRRAAAGVAGEGGCRVATTASQFLPVTSRCPQFTRRSPVPRCCPPPPVSMQSPTPPPNFQSLHPAIPVQELPLQHDPWTPALEFAAQPPPRCIPIAPPPAGLRDPQEPRAAPTPSWGSHASSPPWPRAQGGGTRRARPAPPAPPAVRTLSCLSQRPLTAASGCPAAVGASACLSGRPSGCPPVCPSGCSASPSPSVFVQVSVRLCGSQGCLSVRQSVCGGGCVHLSAGGIHLSIGGSVGGWCPSVCGGIHLSIGCLWWGSDHTSVCPSVHQGIHLPLGVPTCLSSCLSIRPPPSRRHVHGPPQKVPHPPNPPPTP